MYGIIILILLSILFLYLSTSKQIKTLEDYKNSRRSSNICMKPFRPTCNRDKIYSRLKYLEEKIDEMEYDMYRNQKEHKKYNAYFAKMNKSNAEKKAAASAARKKAAAKIQNIMSQREANMTSEVKQKRAGEVAEQRRKAAAQNAQNKKNENAAIGNFSSESKKKSPESQAANDMVNESLAAGDDDDMAEMNDAVKEADVPSGYVF